MPNKLSLPPPIKPGMLSRTDADSINRAIRDLYAFANGVSATPPLRLAQNYGGFQLGIDMPTDTWGSDTWTSSQDPWTRPTLANHQLVKINSSSILLKAILPSGDGDTVWLVVDPASSNTGTIKHNAATTASQKILTPSTGDIILSIGYTYKFEYKVATPGGPAWFVTVLPAVISQHNPVTSFNLASATWTKPANLDFLVVQTIGGGGGGGGANGGATTNISVGGGGGAGGWAWKKILAGSIGATQAYTVGAGGAGGSTGNGSTGGTTSFGTFASATGGGGGVTMASVTGVASVLGGGVGGGTAGDYTEAGGFGNPSILTDGTTGVGISGSGGNSLFGGAGGGTFAIAGTSSINGDSGQAWGAGGGGAAAGKTASVATGGGGANGVVIITEYYTS